MQGTNSRHAQISIMVASHKLRTTDFDPQERPWDIFWATVEQYENYDSELNWILSHLPYLRIIISNISIKCTLPHLLVLKIIISNISIKCNLPHVLVLKIITSNISINVIFSMHWSCVIAFAAIAKFITRYKLI